MNKDNIAALKMEIIEKITSIEDEKILRSVLDFINGKITTSKPEWFKEKVREDEVGFIAVNFWDDYDELNPAGTYVYVEEYDYFSEHFKNGAMTYLFSVIDEMGYKDIGINDIKDGSKEIILKNISYKNLDTLVSELKNKKLSYEGFPFQIYSES